MSNEERIRDWRARRQAGGYQIGAAPIERPDPAEKGIDAALPVSDVGGALHSIASSAGPADCRAEAAATRSATMLARILDALRAAPHERVAGRRAVYDELKAHLESEVGNAPRDDDTADFLRRQLHTTIRLLENDIRAGIGVFAMGYAPATLATNEARLAAGFEKRAQRRREQEAREARRLASRQDVALPINLVPEEAADLATLSARVASLHARQQPADPAHSRLSALLPLLILQLHTIHGESRIALIWALFGPTVLLALISSLYYLTGTHHILGMDVPTFSLLGATTWIMFRQIIFRSSSSYVSARGLLNLQNVTPLMCALVQALIYLVIYLLVFAILITGGYDFDLVSLPSNWPAFVFFVVTIGIAGAAMGLLFGAIATAWRFFLRLATVIERFLEVFSGVFFVSEQLPEQVRPYFLWSPFAHGMQLLRSAYFDSYQSSDASLSYFLTSLVFLMVVAVASERLARSNVQPM